MAEDLKINSPRKMSSGQASGPVRDTYSEQHKTVETNGVYARVPTAYKITEQDKSVVGEFATQKLNAGISDDVEKKVTPEEIPGSMDAGHQANIKMMGGSK